jgi:ubiquinone/menaquinone biosynthesis C-methylase UbiE
MINQEIDYYEDIKYQNFLLSSRRKIVTLPEKVMNQIQLSDATNVVDFGIGKGFFIPYLLKKMNKDAHLWGIDYQEEILDYVLKKRIDENILNFTALHMDKTDHPLLPNWIPLPEVIFTSMCLSTFSDPGLAMDGLIRSLKEGGRLYVIDWSKVEFAEGPAIKDKISIDKMKYLAELYKLEVTNTFTINEFSYGLEVIAGPEFKSQFYDYRE